MKKIIFGFILGGLFTRSIIFFNLNGKSLPIERGKQEENKVNLPDLENPVSLKEGNFPNELESILLERARNNENWTKLCKGKSNLSSRDFEFKSEVVDLNGDEINEYIVTPNTVCNSLVRGASGNGDIFVYQKTQNGWKQIRELEGNLLVVKPEKTDSYKNIVTNWHISALVESLTLYQWKSSDGENFEYLPTLKYINW